MSLDLQSKFQLSTHIHKHAHIHTCTNTHTNLFLPLITHRFFQELNSQLFRTVSDAASSEDHILTVEMVSGVGLDPVKDRIFLTELAKVYDLNFTVQSPTDMFPCCL